MNRTKIAFILALFFSVHASVDAQTEEEDAVSESESEDMDADSLEEDEVDSEDEEGEEEELEGWDEGFDEEEEPALRPPTLEMPDIDDLDRDEEEEEEQESTDVGEEELTSDAELLEESEPDDLSADSGWTTPQSIISLRGYLRLRGELQDNYFLGRTDSPFDYFLPADRDVLPSGGCGGSANPATDARDRTMAEPSDICGGDRFRFANMRLRLRPTVALSDDVRVRLTLDIFDNLVLGSTPDSYAYVPGDGGFERTARSPGVPLDSLTTSQNPPSANRNSARDAILVRHAWAEVTNRDLGQLKFGRMPSNWGLGLLANDGMGIDSDFSTDVDRVMGVARLAGIHILAAWDFAGQGLQQQLVNDLRGVPYDLTSRDDIRQYVFGLAYRHDEEETQARLERGTWVLDASLYFVYRKQFLSSAGFSDPFPIREGADRGEQAENPYENAFVRRNAKVFTPDLWLRFRWGGLRLEAEALFVAGRIENIEDQYEEGNYKLRQFGFAFEGEYRLLDDQLSIRLYTGYASGDADVDGLSVRENTIRQQSNNRTLSHMQFHPNYRIDLILWRNIMGSVAGAWYLRPGVSYDIIRSPFGQLFGVGFDMIYSRAAQEVQTYGSNPNLGVELDFNLYYRSEDGPELVDGFVAQLQYGLLFPLAGLKYPSFNGVSGAPDGYDAQRAWTLRLVMGVNF